jgi:hypothetical protein
MKAKGVVLIRKPFYQDMRLSTDKMEQRMATLTNPKDQREEYHDPEESEYEEVYLTQDNDNVCLSLCPVFPQR